MGFCPFFFRRKTKIMLNQRSDKVELLRIAEAVAIEKSIDKEIILTCFKTYFLKTSVLSVFSQEKVPFDPGFLPK